MKSALTEKKAEVLEQLSSIQQALSRAPGEERESRRHGVRAAIAAAATAITGWVGWQIFSTGMKRSVNGGLQVIAPDDPRQAFYGKTGQEGHIFAGAFKIDLGQVWHNLAESLLRTAASLRDPDYWTRVGYKFKQEFQTNRKETLMVGLIIGGLSALVGTYRYLKHRNQLRAERFAAIGEAVHGLAETVQDHPEILEDREIGKQIRDHVKSIPKRHNASWKDIASDAARGTAEAVYERH